MKEGSEHSDQHTTPLPKRRRRGSSFLLAPDVDMIKDGQVKQEDPDSPGQQALPVDGAENPDSQRAAVCALGCLGCARVPLSDPEWLRPDLTVSWAAANYKGRWCSDCHTCWRTCFSNVHQGLTLFAKWLQIPQNTIEWRKWLLAFILCMAEGMERITHEHVQSKHKLLQFLTQAFGIPLEPSIIIPLSHASKTKQLATLNPAAMCTIRDEEGNDSIGIYMPCDIAKLSTAVQRPVALGPLCSGKWLSTTKDDDKDRRGQLFLLNV